jgi:hypothetical protein
MRHIAIAIRDVNLFLEATVVRKASTDVYVNFPRDHVPMWKPHSSYHQSGKHHQKSFGKAFLGQKKQEPDFAFKGTENLVAFGIDSSGYKNLNLRCDPNDFSDVFEIPAALLRPEKYSTSLYVDLVEPGVSPLLIPGGLVRQQEFYKDTEPWIVLTFLETALLWRKVDN